MSVASPFPPRPALFADLRSDCILPDLQARYAERQHHQPARKLHLQVLCVAFALCQLERGADPLALHSTLWLSSDLYHALTWPQLSYVAEDPSSGKIVGYILAKM